MKQLDLFSFALEDQIIDLKQGEEMEFNRGKERLLIRSMRSTRAFALIRGLASLGTPFTLIKKVCAVD